jgi:hypothetical protein
LTRLLSTESTDWEDTTFEWKYDQWNTFAIAIDCTNSGESTRGAFSLYACEGTDDNDLQYLGTYASPYPCDVVKYIHAWGNYGGWCPTMYLDDLRIYVPEPSAVVMLIMAGLSLGIFAYRKVR